jgi:hypothetical protein
VKRQRSDGLYMIGQVAALRNQPLQLKVSIKRSRSKF